MNLPVLFISMKKYILDLEVVQNIRMHANYVLIKMTHAEPLPEMVPGQFAEIRIDGSPTTFLRRPISINYVDKSKNEVWFLVQLVGDGTRKLAMVEPGELVNVVLPLGNGYTLPQNPGYKDVLRDISHIVHLANLIVPIFEVWNLRPYKLVILDTFNPFLMAVVIWNA